MKRNPAVADMHFREDGHVTSTRSSMSRSGSSCGNGQCGKAEGEPSRTRQGRVDGAVENVATAKHVKFVAAANTVAGERVKKAAELLGLLGCCEVIRRIISHMSQSSTPSPRPIDCPDATTEEE